MIHLQELDHVVLRISDEQAMLDFYCGVLGCTIARRQDSLGLIQLRAGRSLIDLVRVDGELGRRGGRAPAAEGRNMDHFCVRVDPFDTAQIAAHLTAHDVTPGEVVNRFGAQGEGPSMYLNDPEGNVVELKGPPTR